MVENKCIGRQLNNYVANVLAADNDEYYTSTLALPCPSYPQAVELQKRFEDRTTCNVSYIQYSDWTSTHQNVVEVDTKKLKPETKAVIFLYEGRTESHEQLFFFACELRTADEGECGGRWNQLLCYP